MKQRKRTDNSYANSLQAASGAPAPKPAPSSAPAAPDSSPPSDLPKPGTPPLSAPRTVPATPPDAAPLDPPPTAAELYWHGARGEIEMNRYLFGGLLTVTGSLNPASPRHLRANGSPLVKLDFRELTFVFALVWHAFKRARFPMPRELDVQVMLPLEPFMPVPDIIRYLDGLRAMRPDIHIWENVTPENIHDVVSGLRRKLALARSPAHLIENEKPHGYRFSLPPEHLQLRFNGVVFGRRDLQP
jgi:hypothetical protein